MVYWFHYDCELQIIPVGKREKQESICQLNISGRASLPSPQCAAGVLDVEKVIFSRLPHAERKCEVCDLTIHLQTLQMVQRFYHDVRLYT